MTRHGSNWRCSGPPKFSSTRPRERRQTSPLPSPEPPRSPPGVPGALGRGPAGCPRPVIVFFMTILAFCNTPPTPIPNGFRKRRRHGRCSKHVQPWPHPRRSRAARFATTHHDLTVVSHIGKCVRGGPLKHLEYQSTDRAVLRSVDVVRELVRSQNGTAQPTLAEAASTRSQPGFFLKAPCAATRSRTLCSVSTNHAVTVAFVHSSVLRPQGLAPSPPRTCLVGAPRARTMPIGRRVRWSSEELVRDMPSACCSVPKQTADRRYND